MALMSPMLTRGQIEAAKGKRDHPVIKVFDSVRAEHWKTLMDNLRDPKIDTQRLCNKAFIPFAEALEGKVFTLQALELISIWSRVGELFGEHAYPGYTLSTSISCTYGTAYIDSGEWSHLFVSIVRNKINYLGDLKRRDPANAVRFTERLDDISASLGDIRYYLSGTREKMSDLTRKAYREGDEEARRKVEAAIAWEKEHNDDLLVRVVENSGNGMGWMR